MARQVIIKKTYEIIQDHTVKSLDRTVEVGKKIGQFQQDTGNTTRYISKNLYSVEKSADVIGVLYHYQFEFKTYSGQSALLSMSFSDVFRSLPSIPRVL